MAAVEPIEVDGFGTLFVRGLCEREVKDLTEAADGPDDFVARLLATGLDETKGMMAGLSQIDVDLRLAAHPGAVAQVTDAIVARSWSPPAVFGGGN